MGRPKATWKKQDDTLIKYIGLGEDALGQLSVEIVKGNEVNPATSVDRDNTGYDYDDIYYLNMMVT